MAVVCSVRAPATALPLRETLLRAPHRRIEADPVVPVDGGLLPALWVADADGPTAAELVDADPDVARADPLGDQGDGTLVAVEWTVEPPVLVQAVAAVAGHCLEAVARDQAWRLTVRVPDRVALGEVYERCAGAGVHLTVERVSRGVTTASGVPGRALSAPQREVLELAHRRGYFAVPRRVTLAELGAELGVSDAAVSQRLRRGLGTMLEATLGSDPRG